MGPWAENCAIEPSSSKEESGTDTDEDDARLTPALSRASSITPTTMSIDLTLMDVPGEPADEHVGKGRAKGVNTGSAHTDRRW